MIQIIESGDRGHADHGWLRSRHTFSFAGYYDRNRMGFRALRVINEDHVAPGHGFQRHSHRDMEILSYVLEGGLEHKDSMGTGSVIRPGEIQLMRAGTGVTHSEFNHSAEDAVRFLQIWILPEEQGLEPSYDQRHFPESERRNVLRVVASRDGRDGSVQIAQDVSIYASILETGMALEHTLAEGRYAWLQMVGGALELGGKPLQAGDGAAISDETSLHLVATEPAELLLFDLA